MNPAAIVLSGHRDTHFQFLQHLQKGDLLYMEWPTGHQASYTVQELTVMDSRHTRLTNHADSEALILTTCFPFDALIPGGPLRYVVRAEITSAVSTFLSPSLQRRENGDEENGKR